MMEKSVLVSETRRSRRSKRNALRVRCEGHSIRYKTAYDEGEGALINISSGGCVFESATLPVSVQEKVFISIELGGKDSIVEAKAVVVRAEEDQCAVQFTLIEAPAQRLIRTYFIQKLRTQ